MTDRNDDMPTLWGPQSAGNSQAESRGEWFHHGRFAMFIHWGVYSEAAARWNDRTYYGIAEWIMHSARIPVAEYEQLAARFNPVGFDALAWVRLAKAAGMRYLVITAKHHDGFATFHSRVSRFNIVEATPFGRDPLAELAAACRQEGLRLGFYYSQFQDWHEPDAAGNTWDFPEPGDFDRYLREKAMPQIEELLTNYGPVALIWFDTPGTISKEASQELLDTVRRLQPDCLVNSRLGNGLGDYITLGDQEVPLTAPEGLWEAVDTHNDTWAYAWYDHNFKSAAEIIGRLVRTAALGGNYMLNVGPDGRGVIPEESAAILREVGQWVQRNADSIYDTERSPLGLQAWGCSTARAGRLYLHVLHWPRGGVLWVPGLLTEVTAVRCLASGESLPFCRQNDQLRISIPAVPPDDPVTVLELDLLEPAAALTGTTFVQDGLVNTLSAPFAELDGCRLAKRSWMEKFGDWHHADVVEGWTAGATAEWWFTTLAPGTYHVYASYECLPEADGSEFQLSLGLTSWTFPLICTGGGACGRTRLREVRLGLLVVPEDGEHVLSLKALDLKGEGGIAIENLTLRPGPAC